MTSFILRLLLALMVLLNSASLSAGALKINPVLSETSNKTMPCHQTKQVKMDCEHCQKSDCNLLNCSAHLSASLIYTPSRLKLNLLQTAFYLPPSAILARNIQSTPDRPPRFILL